MVHRPNGRCLMPREQQLRIVTNADDAGRSAAINRAIFTLMEEGLVRSATLMANAPALSEACQQARLFPLSSFGVHLNITQFAPLTSSGGLRPLLGRDGTFDLRRVRHTSFDGGLRRAIHEEWCAQIELLQNSGLPVSHIDSHHHVHLMPALLPVLKSVQRRFRIRKVRISQTVFLARETRSPVFLTKKRLLNAAVRHWYATRTTDAFTDLETFREQRAHLNGRVQTVEIMLHPGAPENAQETADLRELARSDPAFTRALISYAEL